MSTDFQKINQIARASLLPDFFAVRIDEEGLFTSLRDMLARLKLPTPLPQLDRIRQIAKVAESSTAFIDSIKGQNLWTTLRDVLAKVQVK